MYRHNSIVRQARTWIGTPFHHQGRLKGKGCDCLGLVVGVAHELGLKDTRGIPLTVYDDVTYSKEPNGVYLTQKLSTVLRTIPVRKARQGDIGLFTVQDNPQHLAILSSYEDTLGMIHAYAPAHRVVEHRLDDEWSKRLIKVFRWPQ